MENKTEEKLITIIANICEKNKNNFNSDTIIFSDMVIKDSLQFAMLIAEVENSFNISFKYEDLNESSLETIGSLTELIESYL